MSVGNKDEIILLKKSDFDESVKYDWMKKYEDVSKYRPSGPIFPDGSINWQCPCMAGGSLVAHRCGNFFRKLYVCMKSDETKEPSAKCPNQFVDWAACMQNMSDERRELMRKAMVSDSEKLQIS